MIGGHSAAANKAKPLGDGSVLSEMTICDSYPLVPSWKSEQFCTV